MNKNTNFLMIIFIIRNNLSEKNFHETLEIDNSENLKKALTIIGTKHNSLESVKKVKEAIYT